MLIETFKNGFFTETYTENQNMIVNWDEFENEYLFGKRNFN